MAKRILRVTFKQFFEICLEQARRFFTHSEPIPPIGKSQVGIVESCLAQPFQIIGGEQLYPTLFDKAAILFYLLIKNHPLQNGNKRTAIVTMIYFLRKNGYNLVVEQDVLYQLTVKTAISKNKERMIKKILEVVRNSVEPV